MARRRSANRSSRVGERSTREWVGGRLPAPFEISGRSPYRPDLVLWLALPEELVLHHEIVAPDVPIDLAASLREAMARGDGRAVSPARVRVASASEAAVLRAAFGPHLEVVVAPTPELDAILADMDRDMTSDDEFESDPASAFARPALPHRLPVGRNDPCPCGSGRKYKKCCLLAAEEAHRPEPQAHPIHALDGRLVRELAGWANRRFGRTALEAVMTSLELGEEPMLAIPWSTYCTPIQGRTIAEHFLAQPGRRLAADERAWLEAQRESWLSVWECVRTEPGSHVVLADLLTGVQRKVLDRAASKTLPHRQALLARVVEYEGDSFIVGAHSRTLSPLAAAEVARKIRARLRRQRDIPCERLRDLAVSRHLLACWEAGLLESEARSRAPMQLQNTDGDPILLTIDHFVFENRAHDAVAARISALEGSEIAETDAGGDVRYAFLRAGNAMHASWDNTIVGHATLTARGLRVETNSIGRADALRERIEVACASLLRHRAREHADPQSPALQRGTAARPKREELPPPEARQLLVEFKARHYADWVDHPLPALGSRTPREAVRTVRGRKDVDLLLKDMENHEAQAEPGEAFDFAEIRRTLGLDA